jgi:hypothetical protein
VVVCLVVGVLGAAGGLGYWLLVARPREQLQKNKEQLLGRWSGSDPEHPGRLVFYEFREDGSFVLTGTNPNGTKVSQHGTWKALGDKGNTLHLSMTTGEREVVDGAGNLVSRGSEGKGKEFKQDVELLSKDRFRLTTSAGRVFEASRLP